MISQTIKFKTIKEGDLVRIIDTSNEYYGFSGIVKSVQCYDQYHSYLIVLQKNNMSINFDYSSTESVYTENQIEKVYKDDYNKELYEALCYAADSYLQDEQERMAN